MTNNLLTVRATISFWRTVFDAGLLERTRAFKHTGVVGKQFVRKFTFHVTHRAAVGLFLPDPLSVLCIAESIIWYDVVGTLLCSKAFTSNLSRVSPLFRRRVVELACRLLILPEAYAMGRDRGGGV